MSFAGMQDQLGLDADMLEYAIKTPRLADGITRVVFSPRMSVGVWAGPI
jgi:hypothetical protein